MKRNLIARRHLMFIDPPEGEPGGGENPPPAHDEFKPITSQEELNRIIGERLSRERGKYADYDDLKTKAEQYDAVVEAARTDQERAVEAAKAEGRTEALSTANTRLVAAEARALAATARFRDPSDAVKFLDLKQVKVNDDGSVDAQAITDQLKALSGSKPYLVDDGVHRLKPDPHQGGTGGGPKPSGVDAGRQLFEARRKPATTP